METTFQKLDRIAQEQKLPSLGDAIDWLLKYYEIEEDRKVRKTSSFQEPFIGCEDS